MKVFVAGGGPAGLCFASFLKAHRPECGIRVAERTRPQETYGWGITLPRRTLEQLDGGDGRVAAAVRAASVAWDRIEIHHDGRRVRLSGTPLLGIARSALLEILVRRCRELDVAIDFDTSVGAEAAPACDLLAIADGAHSAIRSSSAAEFGTATRSGRNRYVWLGTSCVLAGLTLSLASTDEGVFIGHGYPFSEAASTFIVECSEATWERAGLDGLSGEQACDRLAAIFEQTLEGHPLLFRRAPRWDRFTHVTNERWHAGHRVLLGDAAHAVHFSVGSGTMLAIQDARALADALAQHAEPAGAFAEYEEARRPAVAGLLALERASVARLERIQSYVHLEPLALAYELLSR